MSAPIKPRRSQKDGAFQASSTASREAFFAAFASWLGCSRSGVPSLPVIQPAVAVQHDEKPEVDLLHLVVASGVVFAPAKDALFPTDPSAAEKWEGSATDLSKILLGVQSRLTQEQREFISRPNLLGHSLKQARAKYGADFVRFRRTGKGGVWILKRPAGKAGSVTE